MRHFNDTLMTRLHRTRLMKISHNGASIFMGKSSIISSSLMSNSLDDVPSRASYLVDVEQVGTKQIKATE